MKPTRSILCLAALSALCFSLPVPAAEHGTVAGKKASSARSVRKAPTPAAGVMPAEFSDQTGQNVFQVLLAEIALQRGNLDLAAKAYSDLALRTRDPKVLERTVEIAGFSRRFDLAIDAAKLWLDVEPSSVRAQQMLTSVLIMSNKLDELAPSLTRSLENDKESLANNLLGLNRLFARNKDRLAVFLLIDKVCRPFVDMPEAHYAVAMAAASASMYERAGTEVQRALELRPDWDVAALLQAQVMTQTSVPDAIAFMQGYLERHPDSPDMRLHLARVLVNEKRYDEARTHFAELLKAYPDRAEVVYPVALLALQQNDRDLAEQQLRHLATLNIQDKGLAYYYLGQIAEDRGKGDEALAFYALVGPGEHYVTSQLRSAYLLGEQGKLDEARKLLIAAKAVAPAQATQIAIAEAGLLRKAGQNKAAFDLLDKRLKEKPDDPDLLYESALLAERVGKVEVMERRLRRLIELKPDSAQAYNALGYSFAERKTRLAEARKLIEKALQYAPDDTFILDSMGWVLYRQGDLAGALRELERAYSLRDDPEIAAHLGEVLSAAGRKDEARKLLREALEKYPKNEPLREAVKKFAP